MSWKKVIGFAVLIGIYTGVIMIIPSLEGTSAQDIGITYEWWVLFAVIIVCNCHKWWEAALKCFVFFLISQPIIYAVEIATGNLTWEWAWSYYRNTWLPMTVLTLPGGLIAYFCKKQNILGSLILGIANTIEMLLGVFYISCCITNFPYHIVTAVACIALVFVMTFGIQKRERCQMVSLVMPCMLTIGVLIAAKYLGLSFLV